MHTAEKALRLLLTEDEDEAAELAQLLDTQNRERQSVEKEILHAAEEADCEKSSIPARTRPSSLARAIGIPECSGLSHRALRGNIIDRRSLLVSTIPASAREAVAASRASRLLQALNQCGNLLEKFGGHEMAAGLTINEKNFPDFVNAFRQVARDILSDDHLQPCLHLDHELSFAELNFDLLRWHEMLQPFGSGNPQPLFFAREVEPAVEPSVIKEKHLGLRLRQSGRTQRAIFFDGATERLPPPPWDIAFQIKPDEYEGLIRLQLYIHAIRKAAPIET